MSRCNTIIAAALAAAALAAPTALARPADIHTPLIKAAAEANRQDLRSPDTRDAARSTTPSDLNTARPETAGSPNVSADAARSAQAPVASDGTPWLPIALPIAATLAIVAAGAAHLRRLRIRRGRAARATT